MLFCEGMTHLFEELLPYRQIIWDFNGTLIDDADLCVRAVNPLLVEHGLPEIDVHRYRESFRFPVADYYADIGFRVTPEEFSEMSHRFNEAYQADWDNARVFEGTSKLLGDLKEAGKTLAVLSAAWQPDLIKGLQRFDLHDFFEHVFGLENRLAACKIQRGRELLTKSGVSASESVLLGDTLHDLEVGEALGVSVILLTDGHMSEERLRAKHAKVFPRTAIFP